MKKILTRLLSLGLIGATLAIAVPDIFFFSPISNVDLANHYLMVQSGTTQNRINVGDFATSISGAFTGVYVPRSNIDTGFNNTGSDTIIPSEAAIWGLFNPLNTPYVTYRNDTGFASTTLMYTGGRYGIGRPLASFAAGEPILVISGAVNDPMVEIYNYGPGGPGTNSHGLLVDSENGMGIYGGGPTYGVYGFSNGTGRETMAGGIGVLALANSTGSIGLYAQNNNSNGYALGAQGKSYFSGSVGINTLTAQAELDVNGTGLFSGKVAVGTAIPKNSKITAISTVYGTDGIYAEAPNQAGYFVQTGGGTSMVGVMSEAAIPYYSRINNNDERNSYNLFNRSNTTGGYSIIHTIPGVGTPYDITRRGTIEVASSLNPSSPGGYYISSGTQSNSLSAGSRRMVISGANLSFQVYAGGVRTEKYSIAP